MQIAKTAWQSARKLLGPRVLTQVRRYREGTVPGLRVYRSQLEGKRGLEIGGPSGILSDEGPLPVYKVLASLDNCLYSTETLWTERVRHGGAFKYHPQRPAGNQIICEASDLAPVEDSSYECLLASHCLEHVANPLKALAEWRRVLKEDGILLMLLPHRDGTFDWRRTPTTLAHMIADQANQVGEDDLTHLPEILDLHDLEKDIKAGTKEQFRLRCMENYSNRAMHHHVFDTGTALAVTDYAGFRILGVDNFSPYHIIILASRSNERPDNSQIMGKGAAHWRRSPFPSDRACI